MYGNYWIKISLSFVFILFSLIGNTQNISIENNKSNLLKQIEKIPGIDSIIQLEVSGSFKEKYEIYCTQLLDANDSTAGYFRQRVFLSHKNYIQPMVFVTEGYTADYAQNVYYTNELTSVLDGNQIVAEHRYFGKSMPDSLNWKYLTVENAAHDHHILIQKFKKIYTKKWLTTGISKGGQTAIFHMSLYPDDVDFSIPYVAPLNFGVQDGRHEPFINSISSKKDRNKILRFQFRILEKRDQLFPLFEQFCTKHNYSFRIPLQEVYDLCVLEYSFAFWQWGMNISSIPDEHALTDRLFSHFMLVSSPSYFAIEEMESIKAFFIQAYCQIGYYGYETDPFKDLLKIKSSNNYLQNVFLPKNHEFNYDKESMQRVKQFLDKNDPKMIFIYGEYDPWSATAVKFKDKKNMFKFVKAKGSHKTRIKNLNRNQINKINKQINEWLDES